MVALLAFGCTEEPPTAPLVPPPPTTGSIVIVATVTGDDIDPNGFEIRVDDGSPQTVANEAAVVFADLTPGLHAVSIEHIASNCVLRGDNPRTVAVIERKAAAVVFSVHCLDRQTAGAIRVSVVTPGFSAFGAALGTGPVVNALNGKVLFIDLFSSMYSVGLHIDSGACTVDEPNPRTAAVTAGAITDVAFSLTCPGPGRSLLVAVTTTGTNQPGDYTIRVQEPSDYYCYYGTCQFRNVSANGTVRFDELSLVDYYVELERVPANCSASPEFHGNVSVQSDRLVQVAFAVHCT
jgi:hypothetical protein